jgi:hypothetical protein
MDRNMYQSPLKTATLLLSAILGSGCEGFVPTNKMTGGTLGGMSDEELVRNVTLAWKYGVTPELVDKFVGVRAAINTSRDGNRNAIRFLSVSQHNDLGLDPVSLRSSTQVVYWIRPAFSDDTKLIGIAWASDGTSHMWAGTLVEPE